MDSRKIYSSFQEYRKNLDEALYRDKGMKINFYYSLDQSFVKQDFNELKRSVENMIKNLREMNKEL